MADKTFFGEEITVSYRAEIRKDESGSWLENLTVTSFSIYGNPVPFESLPEAAQAAILEAGYELDW